MPRICITAWHHFLHALSYYSRIPISSPKATPFHLVSASLYLPLFGILLGTLEWGIFSSLSLVLPSIPALIVSLLIGIMLTGALHEDGLADFCDGFFGGHDKASTLRIMKDSRIGSFGVTGLVGILAIKGSSLYWLTETSTLSLWVSFWMWTSVYTLARINSLFVLSLGQYCSRKAATKTPISDDDSPQFWLLLAIGPAIIPISFLLGNVPSIGLLLGLLLVCSLSYPFYLYCKHRIGGYTGDCLGALTLLSECGLLLALMACLHA